jgi:hypothetical protein
VDYLKVGVVFLGSFIILYLIYYFFIIKKCKKNKKYVPVEVHLLLLRYRIDINKIDLYKMIKNVSFITVFILSMVITIVLEFSLNTVLSMFIATIFSVLIALSCYEIIGRHYKIKSLKK